MRIIVEGWRFLPHSYAITNQFQLLEMLKYPNLELFHKDIPYLDENWQPATGLLDATAEAAINNIPHPSASIKADATLRISVPYNFAPSNTKRTCLFATTEWGILHNENFRITGAASLREGHSNSDIIIITPSQWSKTGFIRSGATPDRTIVIPCGIDPNIYKPLTKSEREALRKQLGWEGFVFLNVGAGSPNKGIDLLLKAFAVVVESYPEARLVLKGEESIYESDSLIAQNIDELTFDEAEKVLPRMAYIGETLPFAKMAQLYQAADAYVSLYLAEGFNLPALEAIACGLPLICTKGGPTDDFTTPDFAWHVESTFQEGTSNGQPIFRLMPDLEHSIALMKNIIEQPEWCDRSREAGPKFVATGFTWKHVTDQLLEVLLPTIRSPN
ncbi:glycosyltransferase [Microcoleus vaginatus PCC 9802]|uniref:glycosyltransferase n=1 Tax=Microcoleus vaginatus TaxID=119532 RepID=UPI00020D2D4E|nr:glycosyl transferase group 1 [Microcoleus vaginatus FGP-2]UNU22069.1 glycosyltransferase [Microcoleus vaginatus PCC 9802]